MPHFSISLIRCCNYNVFSRSQYPPVCNSVFPLALSSSPLEVGNPPTDSTSMLTPTGRPLWLTLAESKLLRHKTWIQFTPFLSVGRQNVSVDGASFLMFSCFLGQPLPIGILLWIPVFLFSTLHYLCIKQEKKSKINDYGLNTDYTQWWMSEFPISSSLWVLRIQPYASSCHLTQPALSFTLITHSIS